MLVISGGTVVVVAYVFPRVLPVIIAAVCLVAVTCVATVPRNEVVECLLIINLLTNKL